MSGLRSRNKGKRGELEFAAKWSAETGIACRRTQQFAGRLGTSDVTCDELPTLHFEIKRQQCPRIHQAMAQAIDDKRSEQLPIVASRRDGEEWLLTIRLADLTDIIDAINLAERVQND